MTTTGRAPVCRIVAGPNGAGKTTFALAFLAETAPGSAFVNADLLAAALSPLDPARQIALAGRLVLRQIERHVADRADFAFETTLAGRGYLHLVRRLRSEGWRVELLYLALPSVDLSLRRVAERVAHGGHDVPAADVRRRFPRSLKNLLEHYAPAVDETRCLLNVGPTPTLVFVQRGPARIIFDTTLYDRLVEHACP